MCSRYISEDVKRRLYAESMGRCMNPSCQRELFRKSGDVIEKAHIDPYCETADNSFENLVLLCPTCHTDFDKNHAFAPEEVLEWKRVRREELERTFSKQFATFEELQCEVVPLLLENKTIFENYYLKGRRNLWDKFEGKILANNRKLKTILTANFNLLQRHRDESLSNLAYVQTFIAHIDEFEATRLDEEKSREILFPPEINSMFGIAPVKDFVLPFTESLELLIEQLKKHGKFEDVAIGITRPYIQMNENGRSVRVYWDDAPRLRQLYHDYGCFRSVKVRLESLNYALKYIRSRRCSYRFLCDSNLREIMIHNTKLIFVYEYCLSEAGLMNLAPEESSVIVNLHNWNGASCISTQAYALAEQMKVKLLDMEAFYEYINELKQ